MSPTLVDFVVLAPFFPQAPGAAFASSLQSNRRGLFFVLEFKGFWKIELGYAFRNQSVVLVTRQHLNISQLDWSSHFDLNGPKESTQCLGIPWKSHLRDLESGEATNQLGIPWNTNFAVRTKHPECSPFLSFSTHYDLKCSPHTCPCCYMLLLISCPRFALYCWLLHSAQAKLQVRLTRTQHFKHFKLKEVSSSLSLSRNIIGKAAICCKGHSHVNKHQQPVAWPLPFGQSEYEHSPREQDIYPACMMKVFSLISAC